MTTTHPIVRAFAHLARIAVGAVFLVAGLLKGLDPVEFSHQLAGYGIIGDSLTALFSPLLIAIEIALGVAFLAGFRMEVSAAAAAILLVTFIGVEAYGISIGRTEGCGCFGAYVQRTPGEVIAEDLVLLALTFLGWFLLRRWRPRLRGTAAVAVGVAAVLSLGFAIASPHLPLDRWTTRLAPGKSVKDLGLEAKIPGLARGRHLVALLDLGDPGAVEVADRLNEIAARPGAPTVVALTPSSEEETTAFIWSAVPDFEIHPIDRPELKPLYRLLPRFFLVDAGRVTAIFDGSGPPAPDLLLSE